MVKSIIVILGCLFLLKQEKPAVLTGKYRTVFEKKYEQQTYQLVFKDSVYQKVMPDAVTYKGKIKYDKFRAQCRLGSDDSPMEVDRREFGKDSMKFVVKSKTDLSKTTARGILVRVP